MTRGYRRGGALAAAVGAACVTGMVAQVASAGGEESAIINLPERAGVAMTWTALDCPGAEPVMNAIYEISPYSMGSATAPEAVAESEALRTDLPSLGALVSGEPTQEGQQFAIETGNALDGVVWVERITTFPNAGTAGVGEPASSFFVTGFTACEGLVNAAGSR